MELQKIVLVGAGNVAWHLGAALDCAGKDIVQVFSRKAEKAERLGQKLGTDFTNQINTIYDQADLYLLCVSDQAIAEVSAQLSSRLSPNALIVHSSGATPSSVFNDYFDRFGVFYPLQSLSIEKKVDFTKVPICVFANEEKDQENLFQLAQQISNQVSIIDDQQRAVLHVAAVFVNNFSNYLYHAGSEITNDAKVPFELLFPLMEETLQKVKEHAPKDMQTGPAIRDDQITIQRHLEYLKNYPSFARVYQLMSELIPEIKSKKK